MTTESNREIRKQMMLLRKSLTEEEISERSALISKRFLERFTKEVSVKRPLNIGFYQALPFELSLASLEQPFIAAGHRLYFPRVIDPHEGKLEFAHVPDPNDPSVWKVVHYGIREPNSGLVSINPNDLDFIFVPGSAFGCGGERMGMGAGYYDRLLEKLPNVLRVALAFDFQLLPTLEQNPWDQKVHWIITEQREIRASFVDHWRDQI